MPLKDHIESLLGHAEAAPQDQHQEWLALLKDWEAEQEL
jgi:hypothetical protein